MLITSVYTIFIKEIKGAGYLLAHGYTGAVDIVSESVYNYLRNNYSGRARHISSGNIRMLIERGYLTELLPTEERKHFHKIAGYLHNPKNFETNFIFLITLECNLACVYCFENSARISSTNNTNTIFTKETADNAFYSISEINKSFRKHNKIITLYGGEPLMTKNFEIVNYIVKKGRAEGFSFMAITNGYDLDSFRSLLVPGLIDEIQVTIDGTVNEHNIRRPHRNGSGSFDKIISNIKRSLESGIKISIRINLDRANFDELITLASYLKNEELLDHKNINVYSIIINSGDNEAKCSGEASGNCSIVNCVEDKQSVNLNRNKDVQYHNFNSTLGIKKEVKANADGLELISRGELINKYNDKIKKFTELKKIYALDLGLKKKLFGAESNGGKKYFPFRSIYCGAQNGMFIFSPEGLIYTCFELVGHKRYSVGQYADKHVSFNNELNKWLGKDVSNTNGCRKCKYALYCGGGCTAHLLLNNKDFNSSNCEGYPELFKNVMAEYYDEIFNHS